MFPRPIKPISTWSEQRYGCAENRAAEAQLSLIDCESSALRFTKHQNADLILLVKNKL
jgi:hypothetical protein